MDFLFQDAPEAKSLGNSVEGIIISWFKSNEIDCHGQLGTIC